MSKQPKQPIVVDFLGYKCVIQLARYPGEGRIALSLLERDTGEDITVATVNMPEVFLMRDEVLIKDYSENEGMLQALEDAGVVKPTGLSYPSGYVRVPKCLLIPDIPERFRDGDLLERTPARRQEKNKEQDREF